VEEEHNGRIKGVVWKEGEEVDPRAEAESSDLQTQG